MKNLSLMLLILSLSLTTGCSWLGWGDEEQTEEDSAGPYRKRLLRTNTDQPQRQ
jgi:hypothetical protein